MEPPEYLVTRKDGSTFPAIINSMPIFKNQALGLRCVIIEITGQKIAQEVGGYIGDLKTSCLLPEKLR